MLTLKKCSTSTAIARAGGFFCNEKQAVAFMLVDRSVRIDLATFDKTELDELMSQDKIIGPIRFDSAEDANVDPGFTDTSTGKRIKNTRGIKRWNFTFYKGHCFQNEIAKLDQSERYGFMPIFDDGSFGGAMLKDGRIKAFDCDLFVGVKNLKTSTEGGGGSILMIDITPGSMGAWQDRFAVLEMDTVDFTEMNAIAALDIDLPVLVAAATSTVATITNLCADSPVTGLTTPANWKMRRNGTLEAVTAITEVNGKYTFTHAALVANDMISFETNDGGYPVYVLDTDYYVGKSETVKVTA